MAARPGRSRSPSPSRTPGRVVRGRPRRPARRPSTTPAPPPSGAGVVHSARGPLTCARHWAGGGLRCPGRPTLHRRRSRPHRPGHHRDRAVQQASPPRRPVRRGPGGHRHAPDQASRPGTQPGRDREGVTRLRGLDDAGRHTGPRPYRDRALTEREVDGRRRPDRSTHALLCRGRGLPAVDRDRRLPAVAGAAGGSRRAAAVRAAVLQRLGGQAQYGGEDDSVHVVHRRREGGRAGVLRGAGRGPARLSSRAPCSPSSSGP